MAKSRKKIPNATETELLTLSKRRCCICFFLDGDEKIKDGQIAHLDRNRDNNKIDNLAWLCLVHHNQYDRRTSQAKGLTISEVKHHRQALYDFIRHEQERILQDQTVVRGHSESWEPDRIQERLWTNLLEVTAVPDSIYIAETEFRTPKALWDEVRERTGENIEAPLLLTEGRIVTFQNLRELPWSELCDLGTCEEFQSEEWSQSDDEQRLRDFVQLLNRCLKVMLWPRVIYEKKKKYYHFRATKRLGDSEFSYVSRLQKATATVFKGYPKKTKAGIAFYRHAAVGAAFRRFGDQWYVALNPTFHFTIDGEREEKFAAEHLSKKKRLDHNSSVLGQTIMWAEYLKSRYAPLLPRRFDLQFGELATIKAEFGIDERYWQAPTEDGVEFELGGLWDL